MEIRKEKQRMGKQSFSKLTEDLEKMNEQVSKSEEAADAESKLAGGRSDSNLWQVKSLMRVLSL